MTEITAKGLQNLVSICPDPVIGVSRDGTINHFNGSASRLLGYPHDKVVGLVNIASLYGSRETGRAIKRAIHGEDWGGRGKVEGYETCLVTSDGRQLPIRLSATLLLDNDEEIGSIGFFHDMSAAKAMESRLRQLSITDDLSGLYNVRHFNITLEDELIRSRRYGRPLSLMCLDMDNFKQVNDLMGHQEGDKVISSTASTLRNALRSADLAFRYGGDEFMVLLPETQMGEAVALGERIRRATCKCITGTDSLCVDLSVSIGVAEYDMQEDADALMRRADQAMYSAKRCGGNALHCSH